MTGKLNANIASSVSLLLIFCVNVSLFWCNDGNRPRITSDDNRGTSICSFQDKQTGLQQYALDLNQSDCSCICHVPTVTTSPFNLSYHPAVQQGMVNFTLAAISESLPPVFRPPIA